VFILRKMFGPMTKPNIVLFLCTENIFSFIHVLTLFSGVFCLNGLKAHEIFGKYANFI
jgi:hypothetical protein